MVFRPTSASNTGSMFSPIFSISTQSPLDTARSMESRYLWRKPPILVLYILRWCLIGNGHVITVDLKTPQVLEKVTFIRQKNFLEYLSTVSCSEKKIKRKKKRKEKKQGKANKRVDNKYPFCPSLTTLSSSPSLVLIHFTPCSCGSIISGHLSQFVRMVAFSVLMRSLGRFSLFHWAMVALSVNKVRGSRFSVILIGTWRIKKTPVNTLINILRKL